ncbi:hypothetical protein [Methanocella conradii]|uniref:hypothetical protein n=1 Tax=Methanocella conradii TaxID=1175444 RepID=UPI00157CBFD4|nr:hypothetical protein [Methanocella conradii]
MGYQTCTWWGWTRTFKHAAPLLALLFLVSIMPGVLGLQPSINTTDVIHGIIYYRNGTVSYGDGRGTLIVSNPSAASPLTAINVTSPDGSAWFIKSLEPQSNFSQPYTLRDDNISIPLKLNEYIVPPSLYAGTQQEIRLIVEIENIGDSNITGFWYQKALPAGLSKAWTANDGGVVSINDTVTWTLDDMAPGQKNRMAIAFNVTPSLDVNFTAASIHFTYLKPQTRGEPAFSGYTNTSFQISKSHPGDGTWHINATVPDESEFNISLNSVKIYRSPASDPFNTTEIASYAPNTVLSAGSEWKTQLIDYYGLVPSYFIKINYTIPYTLDRKSFFTAATEPFSIAVYSPSPTATPRPSQYSNPYTVWTPTITPMPTPIHTGYPDIVFITPAPGDVIRDNETLIKTSLPPSSDPGYVVYYGSTDNSTWARIGESSVIGNMSELIWVVPQINGKYYLKAEHYDSLGLRDVAYAQVIIAHEIQPVGIITMLISGTDWLMLFLAIIVLMLLLFIIIPYLPRKPIIYDSSSIYVLSKDENWLSKLPRRAIWPDGFIAEIPGVDRIKMRPIRDIDGMKRLQNEYGLLAYDAMALQLAREAGATLYTADKRIYDIGKRLDIDVKPMDEKEVAIKREA